MRPDTPPRSYKGDIIDIDLFIGFSVTYHLLPKSAIDFCGPLRICGPYGDRSARLLSKLIMVFIIPGLDTTIILSFTYF